MKLTIENKHKVLGRVVKHDIVMTLPELIHKGETYIFRAIDNLKRGYSWELTRHPMFSGRYEIRFSDGQYNQKLVVEKAMISDVGKFLYICAAMLPY